MVAPSIDRQQRFNRPAFTLLEVMVVLSILSLGAALVFSVTRRDRPRGDDVAVLVERARGIAVQRGQSMILRVASDGWWNLRVDGAADTAPVAAGRVASATALSARVTPFGGCSPLSGADRHLDAFRCRSVAAAGGAR